MGPVSALAQCALDFLVRERCHACGALLDDGPRAGVHPLATPVDVSWGRLRLRTRLLCTACAERVRPWGGHVLLAPRVTAMSGAVAVHPAFVTDDRLLAIIHLLKFGRRERIAPWLARAMTAAVLDAVSPSCADETLVVPVPMDRASRRRRGFNQAESIGRVVATGQRLEFRPRALAKVRRTAPQSSLGRAERVQNLHGAFEADPAAVGGRRVLLVDDLVTTGATVLACAGALGRAGAREVAVVCAGYRDDAPPAGEAFLQS